MLSAEGTWERLIVLSSTRSRRKWWRSPMCLDRSWWTGFFGERNTSVVVDDGERFVAKTKLELRRRMHQPQRVQVEHVNIDQ